MTNVEASSLLRSMIAEAETQMKSRLEEARKGFLQSANRGTASENSFRNFLRKYLPNRLRVGEGEIIDLAGHRSKQTDVVIINEHHPYTFDGSGPGIFFVEGVCAAGEVKTVLTSQELTAALEASCQFKKLRIRAGLDGSIIYTNPSDRERFYSCPPWFMFAFESQLSLSSVLDSVSHYMDDKNIERDRSLDAVFILDKGWCINFGDGQGGFKLRSLDGKSVAGWAWKESDSVLFDLLGWLNAVVPRIIMFQSILTAYLLPPFGRMKEVTTDRSPQNG